MDGDGVVRDGEEGKTEKRNVCDKKGVNSSGIEEKEIEVERNWRKGNWNWTTERCWVYLKEKEIEEMKIEVERKKRGAESIYNYKKGLA